MRETSPDYCYRLVDLFGTGCADSAALVGKIKVYYNRLKNVIQEDNMYMIELN